MACIACIYLIKYVFNDSKGCFKRSFNKTTYYLSLTKVCALRLRFENFFS